MIQDNDTDEDSGSDPDVTDLFRARSTKRHKTNEEHQRQIEAEARHNAQCEANRRATDERLRRDDAALDAAVASSVALAQNKAGVGGRWNHIYGPCAY